MSRSAPTGRARCVAATLILLTSFSWTFGEPVLADHRFSDVDDDSPLAEAVGWAVDEGIVTGFSDGTFRPNGPVTRAQMVTWLWISAGRPEPTTDPGYRDMQPTSYGYEASAWAAGANIVKGYPDRRFRPRLSVTQGQAITWLWRHQAKPAAEEQVAFTDLTPGSPLAQAASWAVERGVAEARPDGSFGKDVTTVRGTAVQWLHRTMVPPQDARPNVLMVLTDDQTLASMAVMPNVQALIGDAGTTFTQGIATFPLCCPARATHATGQYSHNHGVLDNDNEPRPPPNGPRAMGGYDRLDHTNTVATWLDAAGYTTSYVGKTLNDYNGAAATPPVPPGYDRWLGWLSQVDDERGLQDYFNYEVYQDPDGAAGPEPAVTAFHGNLDEDYLTDMLRDETLTQLDDFAAGDEPWFLTYAPYAPHTGRGRTKTGAGTPPAPRHVGALADDPDLPNDPPSAMPAYDEPDLSDKASWVTEYRANPGSPFNLLNDPELIRDAYLTYLESLLAVDEAVADIVQQLEALGELDDTIIMFTSDNGFHWGENGFLGEKNIPYEPSLRVPVYVRGPGFPAGATVDAPTGDIDFAASIVRATGVTPGLTLDGLALQDIAADPAAYEDRALLINNWPTASRPRDRIWHWEGVRTARYTYVEVPSRDPASTDPPEVELYDRTIDPHQLNSVDDNPEYADVVTYFDGILDQLLGCVGAACDVRADPPEPTTERNPQFSMDVDGMQRTYRVHLPPDYDPAGEVPLVIGIHGAGRASAEGFSENTGMDDAVDARGWVAVYPESIRDEEDFAGWNAGTCCRPGTELGIDDVGFIEALIDKVTVELGVDADRVYVVGQSNGAAMVYRLACELPGRVAAYALGGGVIDPEAACVPDRPISLFIEHGKRDEHIPFEGGVGSVPGEWPSVADATARWRPLSGCRGPLQRTQTVSVITDRWLPCAPGVELRLDALIGTGHRWPGGPRWTPREDGYEVTGQMLDFFALRRLMPSFAPHHFTDAPRPIWYSYALDWAEATGLVAGFTDGTFRPDAAVRTDQVQRAMERFLGSPARPIAERRPHTRAEVAQVLATAAGITSDPVQWAVATGVISNYLDGEFHPSDPMARHQFAVSLYHLAATPSAWAGGQVNSPYAV